MTSFSSSQDQPYKDIQQYSTVNHTTYTYHNALPTTTENHIQNSGHTLEKRFSFSDKIEPNDGLLQKAQTIHTANYASNLSSEPSDINSRLDQLLKNAENALSRSRRREGSVSTYQPIAPSTGPLTDFDAGLSLNSAEVQRRAATNTTPYTTTINEVYTYPPADVEQTLSLNSADIYRKTPVTLTPNATSHRYSPTTKSRPQNLDVQEYNHVSAFGSAEANKKTTNILDSAPNSTSLKYSPIQKYPSIGYESEFASQIYGGGSTKRSDAGPLSHDEPLKIVSYDISKTLPRSYNNLFPIREAERSTHNSHIEPVNNDVHALKAGISNVEDILRSLENPAYTPASNYSTTNKDYLAKTIPTTTYQNQYASSNSHNNVDTYGVYGDSTPNFSASQQLKAKDFTITSEQPKKSFAATVDFARNYSATPERRAEKSFESQKETDQAMRNIDDLMQRHLFEKSPLRKSSAGKSPLRYMSPTRGAVSGSSDLQQHHFVQKTWESAIQPQTTYIEREHRSSSPYLYHSSLQATPQESKSFQQETRLAQTTIEPQSTYIEREHRSSSPYLYRSSIQATPKENKSFQQETRPPQTYTPEQNYKSPNVRSPSVQDLAFPTTYGSTTNYKEYQYTPKTEKFVRSGVSPYSPYKYENSYNKNYGNNDDNGNSEVLNSADRRLKKLTLRAKSHEDSEKLNRYSPTGKRDLQNDDIFSDNDGSQFDFHNSGDDLYHGLGSDRRYSPKPLPNKFNSGELIPDYEDQQKWKGTFNEVTTDREPQANQVQSSSLTKFKAGDLQHDYDYYNSPSKINKAQEPLRGDQGIEEHENKQSFRSGDFEDVGDERVPRQSPPRNKNVLTDDGKAWQMVHKVDPNVFDAEHSFDFDSENAKYQQQMEEAVKMVQRPRVQEPRAQQQKAVDPNLWILNVPQTEAASLTKNSQVLKQSVKKAQKKPIIAHCFEKFDRQNFSSTH